MRTEPQPVLIEQKAFQDPEHVKALKGLAMLSAKPVLYVANVDEDDLKGESAMAKKVRSGPRLRACRWCRCAAKIEAELASMTPEDRKEMLEALGLDEPAWHRWPGRRTGCWACTSTTPRGRRRSGRGQSRWGEGAPGCGRDPHGLRARGFIRAEVYSVDDLVHYKTEKAIKEAGKLRVEGKEYVMQDADVVHFLFNV